MNISKKNISIKKTARYFTMGNDKDPECLWFVCHGYGQLAAEFIKKFREADVKSNLFVAPEGLHRFYNKGVMGVVGASWMTKEDRLDDIEDYVNFLNDLYGEVQNGLSISPKELNILGFSQGAATACRWIANGYIKPDLLVLWAGMFPSDLKMDQCLENLNRLSIKLVVGDNDEYIDDERLNEHEILLKNYKLDYELMRFKGRHDIPESKFKELFS